MEKLFESFGGSQKEIIRRKIVDAGNQILQFKNFDDIEDIKRLVPEANLQTLEEYTGLKSEELESYKAGVGSEYNTLINLLKNSELTMEEFEDIIKHTEAMLYQQ
jgi:hypothetical protein